MKTIVRLILFFCFIQNAEIACSQEIKNDTMRAIATFNMFRDPGYISFGSGIGNLEPLLFEADIVPYYMISLKRSMKWGIELSPRIILRMYNTKSYPIRTPSFMPRVTFFYQLIDNNDCKRDLFTYVSFIHHSNGQDGKFFNLDSTSINTKTGSFSTNWFEAGVFLSRPDHNILSNTNYIKLSVMYNFQHDLNLNGLYGRLRLFGDYQSSLNIYKLLKIDIGKDHDHSLVLTQYMHIGLVTGDIPNTSTLDLKRLIFRYTLTFKPSFFNDLTLFCQYYYGEDYYNIYFKRTLNVFRFGIASKANIFN